MRSLILLGMSALLAACSLSSLAVTPTAEPQLTLEDFPEGIVHSAAPLTDNTKKLILAHANFSDAFGYGFEKAGSDFLGGVTGFLDDESLILEFDESAEANIVALLAGFSEGIAGPDGVP